MTDTNPPSVELSPYAVTSDGDAVAREPSGRVVFVEGAIPGERIRAQIVAERPKSATGRLIELLEVSPHRVAPPCPEVARGCGACQWQHIEPAEQRRMKEGIVANSLRFAGLDPPEAGPTVELEEWSFRTTVRAGVDGGRAGLRAVQSHDVVDVDGCLVAHPRLIELLVEGRYPGAEEVLLRCGARTGERLVATTPPGLAVQVPGDVRSDHLHELAAGRRWRISAGSFFQTRPDGVDALAGLVSSAAAEMGEATTAVDLFAGVGVFAGVLGERGWSVIGVESSPSAVADARVNLEDLDAGVVRSDVARWRPSKADLAVADPSRIGLGRKGVQVVTATGARRLILVSCDAVSLGRDAALLKRAGYSLTALTLVDLFPHTFHVEVVSVFDR